jgi:phage terminase large subunit-like protein
VLPQSLAELRELAEQEEIRLALDGFLRENRPLRYFVPNIGQEKAILPLKTIDPEESETIVGFFCGANMVGKTTAMAAAYMGGIIWGKSELHETFADWNVFDKFAEVRKRERRPLRGRILCHANAMEDGGQVLEEITNWWPKGLYKWEKNHKGYYSIGKCWDYDGNLLAVLNVRTHDQPRNAHAGQTLDFIGCDEPPPKHLWAENVARLRQRMGGVIWGFLSPLDEAGWIKDNMTNDAGVHFTNACIWDNCSDHHPDPAMWDSGVVGKGKLLNRGTRSRKIIEKMIREWEKEGPEIAAARALGEFTHLAGSVLKEFDQFVHVIQPFPIPPKWPITQGLDPHDAKPHLSFWVAQDEAGNAYLFEEHPDEVWDKCRGGLSIPETCSRWREIEAPFRSQVMTRVGDPMRLRATKGGKSVTTFQHEFSEEGFDFELGDNAVGVGLSKIREYLQFDRRNPLSKPHFFIMSHSPYSGKPLRSAIGGMQQFSYKKGSGDWSSSREVESIFEEKWKDPVDVIRYILMRLRPFQAVTSIRKTINRWTRPNVVRAARPWNR